MRNAIIFDYGGILEIHDTSSFCEEIQREFHIRGSIKPLYKKWEILRDLDQIDEHEFFRQISQELKIPLTEQEFYHKYYHKFVKQCTSVLEFIKKKLYGKYELFIFSNNSRINVRKFNEKTHFEKSFKKCVYSYDLQIKKPDPLFFKKGLKMINRKGNECIFFDDQLKSKEAAEHEGMTFIQFTNLVALKKDLQRLKLL